MIRLRHKLLIHCLRLLDQVTVVICLATVSGVVRLEAGGLGWLATGRIYRASHLLAALLVLTGSLLLFDRFVRYDSKRFTSLGRQLFGLSKAVTATAFLVMVVSVLFSFPGLTTAVILLFWAVTLAILALARIAVQQVLRYSRRSGITSRQLLIVGDNPHARRLAAKFEACPELGYRIVGFLSEHGEGSDAASTTSSAAGAKTLGAIGDLQAVVERTPVDEVLICVPAADHFRFVIRALRLGEEAGVVVRIVPDPDEAPLLGRMHLEFFDGQYIVTAFREQLLLQLMLKRTVDVVVSFTLLLALAPLMLAVALIIKATSPGPVLFVQERVGMNRRRFKLFKFRSMTSDAENRKGELVHLNEMDGPVFKIRNDPRVTPFGRFIRKTSIDELPQLLNVLAGQMSLVGPRPPVPQEVAQYDWLFQRRLSIKPGITCLWQVSGRNHISFKQWMELDKEYVKNWSLWLDLKILCRTIPVVLIGRGAS